MSRLNSIDISKCHRRQKCQNLLFQILEASSTASRRHSAIFRSNFISFHQNSREMRNPMENRCFEAHLQNLMNEDVLLDKQIAQKLKILNQKLHMRSE